LFVFVGALTEHLLFEQVSRRNVVLQAHRHGVDGFGERELEVGPVGGGLLAVVFVLEDFPEKLRAPYTSHDTSKCGGGRNSIQDGGCGVLLAKRTAPMWCLGSEVAAVFSTPGHALGSISRNLRKHATYAGSKISGGGARTHVGMWGAT
jgi:hypothetical protein